MNLFYYFFLLPMYTAVLVQSLPIHGLSYRGIREWFGLTGANDATIDITNAFLSSQSTRVTDANWTNGSGIRRLVWRWRVAKSSAGFPEVQVQVRGRQRASIQLASTIPPPAGRSRASTVKGPREFIKGGGSKKWGEAGGVATGMDSSFWRNDLKYALIVARSSKA
ncbi:hypothetical protein CDEST_11848 [Colletotrichum destructivum]|uniref:Uncharacterized protein n=1 Tax=Colletotrichum destructivum TaxID=34406 RepID=A0AAX4IUB4_9PEZI|nr:hypothetical protein CDEST_11848 [Colletotrichum destructivum]